MMVEHSASNLKEASGNWRYEAPAAKGSILGAGSARGLDPTAGRDRRPFPCRGHNPASDLSVVLQRGGNDLATSPAIRRKAREAIVVLRTERRP